MASLADIRAKFPQYNDMSDAQLADSLYAKHYSDMPREQFDAKVGFTPPPNNVTGADPTDQNPPVGFPAPEPVKPTALHSLGYGAQNVAAGLKDTVLAPFDIVAGLQNLIARGINYAAGTNIPQATPASAMADKAIEASGVPVLEPQSSGEKLGGSISRFGTQALSMAGPLAMMAPAREATIAAGGARSGIGDAFMRPYFDAPARTVAGDAAAGVGAGAATNAVGTYLPDKKPDTPWMNNAVDVARGMAPLIGGVAGSTMASMAEGTGRMVKDAFTKGRPDKNIPLDAANPSAAPATKGEVEKASRVMQDVASNPEVAARNIRENADTNAKAGMPQPTVGLVSGDVGLQSAESAARTKNGVPFIENDNKLRSAATERVNSLRDPGADQAQPAAVAKTEAAILTKAAEDKVKAAEGDVSTADAFRQQQAAPIAAGANADAKAKASQSLDKAVVEGTYLPDRQYKNALYDNVPPGTTVDTSKMAAKAGQIQENVAKLPPSIQGKVADQGVMTDLAKTESLPYDAASQTRMALSDQERAARSASEFGKADTTRAVRQPLQESLDAANPEAAAYYKNQYGPTYRPGPGDEGQKFTQAIDRDPNRTTTPPSDTAGRFLSSPRKVDSLQRMVAGAPSEAAANKSVGDYLRSDFGMSALNPDGTLNPARAAAWGKNNADVLAKYPAVRKEFDDLTAAARRGDKLSGDAKAALDAARKGVKATEQDIERSAAGTLLKEDPRDTARRIFGSPSYGAEKELDGIQKLIGGDKQAARGWKAAVSEYLSDTVSGTTKIDAGKAGTSETTRVELSKLDKMFANNRALLAKVYTPEEMNTLQQAHSALEPLKNATVRATGGSNTADKGAQMWRMAEAGLKVKYGILKGGGIMRTIKLMASTLPDDAASIQRIVERAWFDPDIAEYLLTNKVRNLDVNASNAHVRRLMGAAAYGRSTGDRPQE